MKRLQWILAGVAAQLLMAGQALADFTYSVAVTPAPPGGNVAGQPPGSGPLRFPDSTVGPSSVELDSVNNAGVQSTAGGAAPQIALAKISVTDTATVAQGGSPIVDSTSIPNLTLTVTLTPSPTTGQTYQFTVTGTLAVTTTASFNQSANNGAGGTVYSQSLSFTPPTISAVTPGGVFSLQSYEFSGPTVNVADSGSISINVAQTPEPSSMALVGVGALLLVAPRLRRRRAAKS